MAPVNFDNEIKKTLEERTLKPSAEAWSKLESQLDEQPSNSNISRTWWLAVAASLIAIAWFWFNNESSTNATEKQQVEINEPADVSDPITEEAKILNEEITKAESNAVVNEEVEQKPAMNKVKKSETKAQLIQNEEVVAEVTVDPNLEAASDAVQEKSIEQQRIDAIVTQMKAIDSTDHWSIDNEVDALLAEAQRNIKLEKLYNEALNSIDSNALLEEIEDDLNQSFRAKVFEALKSSYKTVKTAVAERNN